MLLGPALSRDGFAGAAQNTRHRGGGLVALVEKEQRRWTDQDRTRGTDDLPDKEIWMTLRRIPVGNTRAALHVVGAV